jgi:hypothetical protein
VKKEITVTSDQFKLAAEELRARANMHIGDPVGERCRELAKSLDELAGERVPYAWEVNQGTRVFLISAKEFTRSSYDYGSFKPLFE